MLSKVMGGSIGGTGGSGLPRFSIIWVFAIMVNLFDHPNPAPLQGLPYSFV